LKVSFDVQEFARGWRTVERGTSHKSSLTAVGGVKVLASGNQVSLWATDLKVYMRFSMPSSAFQVEEEGACVIPVSSMGDMVRKLSGSSMTVEAGPSGGVLRCGRLTYRFPLYSLEEFPSFPQAAPGDPSFSVSSSELDEALEEGTFAGSQSEEFPPYLSSALFSVQEGSLSIVSTDGKRLAVRKLGVGEAQRVDRLLPIRGLMEVRRALQGRDEDEPVLVRLGEACSFFETEDLTLCLRNVDAKFPDYQKVIPSGGTTVMECPLEELRSALERVEVLARRSSKVVVMRLSPGGGLTLECRVEGMGETVEELEADVDGEPLRVGFNVSYLLDPMKVLSSSSVRMTFRGSREQMVLQVPGRDDFLYVLMPVSMD